MSNGLGIDYAADAAEMATDMPSTLVWGSQTVTGTRGEFRYEQDPELSGFNQSVEVEWQGAVADFSDSTPPTERTQVTVDGVAVKVQRRQLAQDGAVVVLLCNRMTR